MLLPPFLSDTITTELEALGASFSVHNGVVDIGKVRITRPPEMNFKDFPQFLKPISGKVHAKEKLGVGSGHVNSKGEKMKGEKIWKN